jgi:hypothetical protein
LRLLGKVQPSVVLCAYGMTKKGKCELIDFLLAKAETPENWKQVLLDL